MLKVFQVSDFDWYLANTAKEARDTYLKDLEENGGDLDSVYELEYVYELTDEDMETYKYTEEDGSQHSFREELEMCESVGFFASTEY